VESHPADQDVSGLLATAEVLLDERWAITEAFDRKLFVEPAWTMLLLVFAAFAKRESITVGHLRKSVGLAPASALRALGRLEELGLIARTPDLQDLRRVHVIPTIEGFGRMAEYLTDVARDRIPAQKMPGLGAIFRNVANA